MKNTVILVIMLFLSTSINAQTVDPWTKYMTPNEVHTLLGEYVGEFSMEISMWMTEGNAPEIVTISSTHKMILGNRFLEMTQTGNMMGMDYASVSTLGYNTIDHHMSIISLTNMGTGTSHLTGAWDSKTKTALLIGQTTNPMDTKPIQVRQKNNFYRQRQFANREF